jgi:hypothetical protein
VIACIALTKYIIEILHTYCINKSTSTSISIRLTDFATASFRPANVETMGAVFRSWVSRRATAPDRIDGCVVVPRAGRFQIAMSVDADERVGGEEDGGNLIIFCELEDHDIFWLIVCRGMQLIFYELKEHSPRREEVGTSLAKGSCRMETYGPGGEMIVLHCQLVNDPPCSLPAISQDLAPL